jgi:DNA-binding Lrp family transcriptional regulator
MLKLIGELMKNSRRSDRELARALGTSQPTVTRVRNRLEKEGVVKEYTMIPDFVKLGYELMAFTFIAIKPTLAPEEAQKGRTVAQKLIQERPAHNIILLERGMGLHYTGVIVSFHKTYSDFEEFMRKFRRDPTSIAYVDKDIDSFLVNLKNEAHYRSLTLSTLAKHLLIINETKELETDRSIDRTTRNIGRL